MYAWQLAYLLLPSMPYIPIVAAYYCLIEVGTRQGLQTGNRVAKGNK